ncbi:MAG: Coenzyme F420 hydrogenase/dehydrogenase, beta subunit C-terminal domain [Candidatus Bathyarchaeota archaeon]|nr:Coenzyme F420 hydrogenase/dehydrogenase, beta subunit C-terminal domain [Candidatus Bathyarchaeota archaeon]
MELKGNSLIAYNVLEKKILNNGFCTLCGACEAACPTSALHIISEKVNRLYDCSKDIDLCPICYEICPHSEALLLRSLKFVADAPIKNEAIGYYRKMVLAQAVDPKLRQQSHGGAVVTALLNYGIETKIFDSAIVSQSEPENPSKPKPAVALVPDDILSAVGSKFFPSSVAKAYGSAVYSHGKSAIAFVGVPCHVLALRKMEAWQHKIIDKLKITIGLFCFGTFSFSSMLEYIEKTYKIRASDIKQMHLSSKFAIQTEKGEIRIPLSEIEQHIMPSCRTCMDFTSELADISVGGAYPLKDWSTVIIRTKAGEDFFYKAVENGIISTWVIEQEPKVFERVMLAAMQKRAEALKKAMEMEEYYGYLPTLLLRETPDLAKYKVEEIMTKNIQIVPESMFVSQFLDYVAKHHHIGYPVENEKGELVGWVTIEEAANVAKKKRNETSVGEIARKTLVVAYPDETALDVFKRMSEYETGRVVVIDRVGSKLLGIVTKADLMHALAKQAEKRV